MPSILGKRYYYGWVNVGGAFILNMLNQAGFTWGFTVFVKPLGEEFGWSLTSITLAWACSLGWSLVVGPWTGRLFDRYGPKPLTLTGGLLAGSGWLLIPLVHQYWLFFVLFVFFVGTGLNATMGVAGSATIAQWFRKRRTLAMGVYHLGSGTAGLLIIPVLSLLTNNYGWRAGAVAMGACITVSCAVITPLMRHRPERYGLQVDGAGPGRTAVSSGRTWTDILRRLPLPKHLGATDQDFSLGEALRTWAFWLFGVAIWLRYFGMGMTQVHLYPHMAVQGFSADVAAAVLSLSLLVNMPSRIAVGWLGDIYDKKWLLNICALTGGIGLFALAIATPSMVGLIWVYPILWGIGLAMLPLQAAWLADMYGRKHYGSISATSNSVTLSGRIVGALVAAAAYDMLNSYSLVFAMGAIGFLVGAGLLAFLPGVDAHKHGGKPEGAMPRDGAPQPRADG